MAKNEKHPWNRWLYVPKRSRKVLLLREGKDYTCQSYAIIQQIRNKVCVRKLPVKVSASILDTGVVRIELVPRSRRRG